MNLYDLPLERKKPSVSSVYHKLRTKFGSDVAKEIMDNLEGNDAGYNELVKLVIEDRLDDL